LDGIIDMMERLERKVMIVRIMPSKHVLEDRSQDLSLFPNHIQGLLGFLNK